ncbi:MAG: hypothetical protein IJS81_11180 [Selenomonadaceae bacterium]|nr:hypothetical protein [Selenomonadaceae bacterium]
MKLDKNAILARIRTLQKELDGLVDAILEIEDTPAQPQKIQIQAEPDTWLTAKQVCKNLNIAYTTFFEWLKAGKLPPGHEFSARSKRWRMSDIEKWRVANIAKNEISKRRGRPSKIRRKEEFSYA